MPPRKKPPPPQAEPAPQPPPIVAVGASAGGVEAFLELLLALPCECAFALVLILHGDAHRPSAIREVIARNTSLPVMYAEDGMVVEPSRVYVIPSGVSATTKEGRLHLEPAPEGLHPCPNIDHFFESLADASATGAIGVLLSGSGHDGAVGLAAIRAAGGATICQDPKSARFPMMLENAIGESTVDFVLPPHLIARELAALTRHPFVVALHQSRFGRSLHHDADQLARILVLLRSHSAVDFSSYKQTTVLRRIRRRMALHDLSELGQYADMLLDSRAELEALYADMLINVTRFFREPESFEGLHTFVFPAIFEAHREHENLRVWVPGCSTGEQVYSVAIAIVEAMQAHGKRFGVQLFGTDISDEALTKARNGRYPRSIADHVSPEQLERFFVRDEDGYRICKQIREMCVFARQNVLVDPPFSRLDLIVCTNLLIYLDGAAQRRLIPFFHYALRPSGFLMLGLSESVGGPSGLFSLVDKRHKIYIKRSAQATLDLDFSRGGTPVPEMDRTEGEPAMNRGVEDGEFDASREADRLLLARYAPAGVVVNGDMDIVQFRGRTGMFLEPASGPASHNIYKMAREGLLADLRAAAVRARDEGVAVRREGVRVRVNDHDEVVTIEVVPMRQRGSEMYFLVTFQIEDEEAAAPRPRRRRARPGDEVERLRRALEETQAELQAIIEEKEAANEELKAANEEIQSSNEELQSTNEELQTVKEEIQSANEELSTINDELQTRNFELNAVNNDLNNLLSNVTIPLVMLGQDLRIRRFTPMAEKLFNMIPGDVGRPITDINLNLEIENLGGMVRDVLETLTTRELRLTDRSGHWYAMRIRPYRTAERKVDGVVLALFELDELRQSLERERELDAMLEVTLEAAGAPLLIFKDDGTAVRLSRAMRERLGLGEVPLASARAFELPLVGPAVGQYLAQAPARGEGTLEVDVAGLSARVIFSPLGGVSGVHVARLDTP